MPVMNPAPTYRLGHFSDFSARSRLFSFNPRKGSQVLLRVLSRCSHPGFPPHSENTMHDAFGVALPATDAGRGVGLWLSGAALVGASRLG